jgi:dTDP-4-dehydrorhamnose reductase
MNILILGSSGLLGRELFEFLKSYKKINIFHNGLKSRKFNIDNKSNPNLNSLGSFKCLISVNQIS